MHIDSMGQPINQCRFYRTQLGTTLNMWDMQISSGSSHLAQARLHPRLPRPDKTPDGPLWPVIDAAANLLTSPDRYHVRECIEGTHCWSFVDRSKIIPGGGAT